jgi:chromate reductase
MFGATEYNCGISGAFKNAIDWGSRGDKDGNLFNEKPSGMIGAGGGMGSLRSQNAIRDSSVYVNTFLMNQPQLTVNLFVNPAPVDWKTGDITDPKVEKDVINYIKYYIAWINRFKK